MSNRYITRLDGTDSKFFSSDNISFGDATTWEIYMQVAFDASATGSQTLFSIWGESAPTNSIFIRRRSTNTIDVLNAADSDYQPLISVPHNKGGIDEIRVVWDGSDLRLILNGVETVSQTAFTPTYVTDGTAVPVRWGNRGNGSEPINGAILKAGIFKDGELVHRYHFNDNGGAGVVDDLVGDKPLTKNGMSAGDVSSWDRVVSPAGWTDGADTFDYNFDLKYAGVIDAGQSNNLARASAAAADLIYEGAMGAQQLAYSTQVLANAVQPLDHVDESAGDMSSWLVFANNLVNSNYLPLDSELCFIPVAEGGTSVSYWAGAGNGGYDQMLASVVAFQALNSDNYIYAVRWIQGEANASVGTTAAAYLSSWNQFRDGLIADVASITNTTPFLLTEIAGPTGSPAAVDEINQGLADCAAQSFYIRLSLNTDLTLSDTLHYDAASQRIIGQRNYDELVLSQSAVELTLNVSGAPDGTYDALAYKAVSGGDEVVLYQGPVTFSSESAIIEVGVLPGDKVFTLIYSGIDSPLAISENTVS